MGAPVRHIINNNTFWLLSQRALFWEDEQTLIVSDLHLGKSGHFRKEGIAVPQSVYKQDLHRLFDVIQRHKPAQLIIAGDMFHSRMNKEVDLFTRWRNDVSQLPIHLVKGNHDILHSDHYTQTGITVTEGCHTVGNFCFVHDINDVDTTAINDIYYFSGHIHPAVILPTGSRQSVRLPCYYFSKTYAVLPAFSAFSGMYSIRPKKTDTVYAIVNDNVIAVRK